MLQLLKNSWRELKAGRPGERFQEWHHRSLRSGRGWLRKLHVVAGGVLVMAAGVFFLPAPGPGLLILLFGAALLAQESLIAARAFDWTEIQLRRLARWGKRVWKRRQDR